MTCKSCTSENRRKFASEIAIHFPGLKDLDTPHVFVFPTLLVCMDCGFTEFAIPETELFLLGKNATAPGTTRSPTLGASVYLGQFVAGLPFSTSEIKTAEYSANEPPAMKNGFYRH
jgi:hypothetical protein